MERTGSIPPGTVVTWQWLIRNENGQTLETNVQELTWSDTRYEWSGFESGNVRYHWYDGDAEFGQTLAARAEDGLGRLEFGTLLESRVEAFVYADSATLQGAVLYTQAWTGGLAFTSQNILLIAIDPAAPASQLDGLIHELAHLLINEVTFSCIGDLPTWLSEGLAKYAEGPASDVEQAAIDEAMVTDDLITIRSLSSSFPADHSSALLAYAQSKSIVTYLIEAHGWTKMNELLAIFKRGSTNDRALTETYDLDMTSLDAAWREWLPSQ